MSINNETPTKFLRMPQVREIAGGVAPSTIWGWIRKGIFPKPVYLSSNCSVWPSDVIEQWAKERIEASQEKQHISRK